MTNISKAVHRFIDQDSTIRRDLGREIINIRSLAKYMQPQLGVKADIDAIISAIRRYELDNREEKRFERAVSIIKDAKISTKNHISIIALVKDSSVQALLPKLFSLIDYGRGEVLRIIQAEELIKIVVDQKNVVAVLDLFPKSKIKNVEKNLG